ncbi:MAG: aspartyl/glutamyl-tRNA amidotransferase subunit C [Myxococcales bacterium]|nr:aspartyl/glutamyl-tRNA amidotransferase subunit C [Myxococcales bacterium]
MDIPLEEVRRLAQLAHLEYPDEPGTEALFSDEQLVSLQRDIASFLDHVADLQSVNIDGVPAITHGVPVTTRLRDDIADATANLSEMLDAAPASDGLAFMVPKVVE